MDSCQLVSVQETTKYSENFPFRDSFFNSERAHGEKRRKLQLTKVLSTLLIASAVSLGVGGVFLYAYALVPIVLVETTIAAVVILCILSYPVSRGNMIAINISTVLGVVAPIISLSTPAHVGVLEQIGTGGLISFLGILQLLGFYTFPIIFVLIRIVYNGKLKIQVMSSSKALVKN